MSKSYLRKVRAMSQAKQKRGTIKRATKSGTEETYRRRVTHLPLWQHLDLGVWNDQVQKVIAIGTHSHTGRHIFAHTKLHTQNTQTRILTYYYIKRNKSSVLEHIDYYNYY